jgi:fibronectin-binding autotransporter adhesin
VANDINLRNNSSIVGSNNLTLSGALTQNGSNLSLTVNNAGATELVGPVYLSEASGTGRTLTLVATTNTTVSGAISNFNGSGTAGALRKDGAGALVLSSSSSSYTGRTETMSGGVLSVSKLANGGSNSSIGASTNAAGNLVLANGTTLRYTGSGDSTDRLFTIDGSGTGLGVAIDASGSGALNFTNTGSVANSVSGQSRTLTLEGSSTENNTFATRISNNGAGAVSVAKSGAGKWILAGNNTYTGATIVNAGTLLVDGSIAAGSTVSVAAGATLGGSGTISGVANVYGKLAPGNGPGILAFGSALNLDSSAQIDMELNGPTRGTGYDGVNVGGLLTYGGQLALTVGSRFLESSQSFSLFSFAAQPAGNLGSVELSGAYGVGPFASTGGGNWQLTDAEGNQWVFSQANGQLAFTAVPEPSTWALVCLGASLFAAARFRRKD